MITWQASDVYGQRIALGPVQARTLALCMELTAGGRRPELTLHDIAARISAPVSSVHEALRRLRALGLLGVMARMGRHGGHRLWRVTKRSDRDLDPARRRQAIARITARFGSTTQAHGLALSVPDHEPTEAGTEHGPPPSPHATEVVPGPDQSARPLDPFLGTPMPPAPLGSPPGEWEALTFAEKMARKGYRPET